MTREVTVVAKVRAAKGKGDALAALLTEQVGVVRKAEPGCLAYRVHRSTKDPEVFLFYETYVDDAAFAAHRRTEHFRVNIEQTLVPMLEEREWRVYGAPIDSS